MYTIIEHEKFQHKAKAIWSDDERLEFFSYIANNPLAGDVIMHADGMRKIRWQANGKGKRGGVRVIYFNLLEDGVIVMLDIYAKNEKAKNWDVDAIVKAIVADDPEMAENVADLQETLMQVKSGKINWRATQIPVSAIVETRQKVNLSQPKFAEKLGIPVNTLRSWEQGLRKPSGAAKTLLGLLHKYPELVNELPA